jgi:hypothetical protein
MKKGLALLLFVFFMFSFLSGMVAKADPERVWQDVEPLVVVCKVGDVGVELDICSFAFDGYVPQWSQLFIAGVWDSAKFTVVSTGKQVELNSMPVFHGAEFSGLRFTAFDFLGQENVPKEDYAVKVELSSPFEKVTLRFIVRVDFPIPGDVETPVEDSSWGW